MTDARTPDEDSSRSRGSAPEPARAVTIEQASALLGLELTADQIQEFQLYLAMLLEANERMNLTAIRDPAEAESRLIAESLAVIPLLPDGVQRLLDVGTGGGVPAIPLAIARPELRVDALDATGKKVDAVSGFARDLGLEGFRAFHGRAEDLAHDPAFRAGYGIVVSRAVARLATLVELTLPFLAPGGKAVFPKGSELHDEVNEARQAITTLGGGTLEIVQSPVNAARFVVIEQVRLTPDSYPRRPGIPARQPIGVPAR